MRVEAKQWLGGLAIVSVVAMRRKSSSSFLQAAIVKFGREAFCCNIEFMSFQEASDVAPKQPLNTPVDEIAALGIQEYSLEDALP